jgi:hypothetical protein
MKTKIGLLNSKNLEKLAPLLQILSEALESSAGILKKLSFLVDLAKPAKV